MTRDAPGLWHAVTRDAPGLWDGVTRDATGLWDGVAREVVAPRPPRRDLGRPPRGIMWTMVVGTCDFGEFLAVDQ